MLKRKNKQLMLIGLMILVVILHQALHQVMKNKKSKSKKI